MVPRNVVDPFDDLKIIGQPLNKISAIRKEAFLSTHKTYSDILDRFWAQIFNKDDRSLFLYKFYLGLVAKNWINPTDEEVRADLWITLFI